MSLFRSGAKFFKKLIDIYIIIRYNVIIMSDQNNNILKLIVDPLLNWYNKNRRDLPWRHNPTPYRVWVSEIMLQQTRVDPVIPYYLRFMDEVPDVEHLASLPEERLLKLWEGLGYYSRARNLQKAAKSIVESGDFPSDFDGWRRLSGIGDYTAGAICSIALGLPTPAVDGNVLRVLSRLLGSYDDIANPAVKKRFTQQLADIYPEGHTSEFTQSLMELGAIICLPNGEPKCDQCPLAALCKAKKQQLIDQIPVKAPKKPRKIQEKTILLLRFENCVAVQKRPAKGLLANLWEYPSLEGKIDQARITELFESAIPKQTRLLPESTHIFSHIEWHMIGYDIILRKRDSKYHWVPIDDALNQLAIPKAFQTYTNILNQIRYEE